MGNKSAFGIATGFLVGFALTSARGDMRCPGALRVRLETGGTTVFCRSEGKAVSETCYSEGKKCTLLADLHVRLPVLLESEKAGEVRPDGNPGAAVCRALGYEVVMGKLGDGSAVCACRHAAHELVLCGSLTKHPQFSE